MRPASVMTEDQARQRAFEQVWPTVETRLRRVLAVRHVPESDRDDFLQEVAARALATGVTFTSADDLLPWASTVLRRIHLDAIRRRKKRAELAAPAPPAAAASPTDVAGEVAARMQLAAVARVVSTWSADAREALLGSEAEAAGTRQTSAFYVKRHRLRLRLLAAIDGVAAFWIGAWNGLARRVDPNQANQAAVWLTPVAAMCVVAGSFGVGHEPPLHRPAPAAARASIDAKVVPAAVTIDAGSPKHHHTPATNEAAGLPPTRVLLPPDGPYRSPLPLVYEHLEVHAGNQPAYVEGGTKQGPQPLWCVTGALVVPDQCVGQAPNIDLPDR